MKEIDAHGDGLHCGFIVAILSDLIRLKTTGAKARMLKDYSVIAPLILVDESVPEGAVLVCDRITGEELGRIKNLAKGKL